MCIDKTLYAEMIHWETKGMLYNGKAKDLYFAKRNWIDIVPTEGKSNYLTAQLHVEEVYNKDKYTVYMVNVPPY